jgi:hypothetical protein
VRASSSTTAAPFLPSPPARSSPPVSRGPLPLPLGGSQLPPEDARRDERAAGGRILLGVEFLLCVALNCSKALFAYADAHPCGG